MKQYTLLYIAAAAIAATACTVSQMPDNQQTRRITVSTESIGTKTGIEYEYSIQTTPTSSGRKEMSWHM